MTDKINVMVNGLPGKMAREVADAVARQKDMELVSCSLTGAEITARSLALDNHLELIRLIRPDERDDAVGRIHGQFISVDYTQPDAVNDNASFYCRNSLPFVMGTTGGNREALVERVRGSQTCAVIAPNMAAPIVSLMDFMERYSKTNEGAFTNCKLGITESHQAGKKDTSGTARAIVKYFNRLGIQFDEKDICMIREPERQRGLGVPEEHLKGHGWHTYTVSPKNTSARNQIQNLGEALISRFFVNNPALRGYKIRVSGNYASALSPDSTVFLELAETPEGGLRKTHNINGRSVYAAGTLEAIRFSNRKAKVGEKGAVYSMIDVLKG